MPERRVAEEIASLLHDALNQLQVSKTRTQLAEEQLVRAHKAQDRAVQLAREGLELASQLLAGPGGRLELNAVIQEVVADLVDVLGVEIRAETSETKLWTQVDHAALLRALDNLARNAARAMPQGGVLTISAGLQDEGQMVCIRVGDTGHGMDAETLARIWDPTFFSTKVGPGPHGLGLYQVKKFVEDHGGRAHVASTRGEGTIFDLCFPRVLAPDSNGNNPSSEKPEASGTRLAVEAVETATRDAATKATRAVEAVRSDREQRE
jgi:signal transduction histidine kinase